MYFMTGQNARDLVKELREYLLNRDRLANSSCLLDPSDVRDCIYKAIKWGELDLDHLVALGVAAGTNPTETSGPADVLAGFCKTICDDAAVVYDELFEEAKRLEEEEAA